MKTKSFDAVELKRKLQTKAEEKLLKLSQEKQLEFLRKKFGRAVKKAVQTK